MRKKDLWEKQSKALRNPSDIFSASNKHLGHIDEILKLQVDDGFIEVLSQLNKTLFVSREYEHLICAITIDENKLVQTHFSLPHPSGMATNNNKLYVAATRNPNQIWEFVPLTGLLKRTDRNHIQYKSKSMVPLRSKVFPGAYYIHDLGCINGTLYANSVGQNAIISIQMDAGSLDEPIWWPKSIEKNDKADFSKNYLQLNSIAGGKNFEESFFSASCPTIGKYVPGDMEFQVDKQGVIFSAKTREVYAQGLTRPHSARLHNKNIWVDNSGYGEFGYISSGAFEPIIKLDGWTRGLHIINNYAFVGFSRVLPKFAHYAPGLDYKKAINCGIVIVDLTTGQIKGTLIWPYANQIFAIESLDKNITSGFIKHNLDKSHIEDDIYYRYTV